LGGVCAKAVASENSTPRQINRLTAEAVEDLISGWIDCVVEAWSVEFVEAIRDARSANLESPRRRVPLSLERQFCRQLSGIYLVTKLKGGTSPPMADGFGMSKRLSVNLCRMPRVAVGTACFYEGGSVSPKTMPH
jgi:hypothetical protein